MGGARPNDGKQAAVGVVLHADVALGQGRVLHVARGFHGNQVRNVIPQTHENALFNGSDQISVAALFGLAGGRTLRLQIPDGVTLLGVLLGKFLHGRVILIRVFVLDRVLIGLVVGVLGILPAVQSLIFGL